MDWEVLGSFSLTWLPNMHYAYRKNSILHNAAPFLSHNFLELTAAIYCQKYYLDYFTAHWILGWKQYLPLWSIKVHTEVLNLYSSNYKMFWQSSVGKFFPFYHCWVNYRHFKENNKCLLKTVLFQREKKGISRD